MTDELEQQVSEMLHNRVADLPALYDVEPSTLRRARRRRVTKLGALTTALVLVTAGTAAGVARAMNDEPDRAVVATQGPPTVRTARCELHLEGNRWRPALVPLAPRVPAVRGPSNLSGLVSYAAIDDPRTVVLGPERWSCRTNAAVDGSSEVWVTDPQSLTSSDPAIPSVHVQNATFDGHPTDLACSVFFVELGIDGLNPGACLDVFPYGRDVSRVTGNVSTFVDDNGWRGAGHLVEPSYPGAGNGSVSVLTCRPAGRLSPAVCDTIVADWVARVRVLTDTTGLAASTTTTTRPTPAGMVPAFGCEGTGTVVGGLGPVTPAAGDSSLSGGLASFLADVDGNDFFRVLGPRGWACRMVEPAAGGPIVVFDPTKGSGSDGRAAPIQLDFHPLWGDRPDYAAACAVFDDPAIEAYVTRQYPIRCPETSGLAVTRVGSYAATFVAPDNEGTRGAAWYRLPSSDDADDGQLFVLSCRPTAGLSREQCDTIAADYATRIDAWVPPR